MAYNIPLLSNLDAEISCPADKSISHRAILASFLCRDTTKIVNFLDSEDTRATIDCVRRLGGKVEYVSSERCVFVKGVGKYFPVKRKVILYAQESGTTIRIMSGLLVGQSFKSIFHAAPSLQKRPMRRIIEPLREMGASISGMIVGKNEYPPLTIHPVDNLRAAHYRMPVSSAQVKSAILFASLYAKGISTVIEPYLSRDHTERMLSFFSGRCRRQGKYIYCQSGNLKSPREVFVPGDISSAAFFIVLGLISSGSKLLIRNVGINNSRVGLLKVLRRMGGWIRIVNRKNYFEPYADILVKHSALQGTVVHEKEIPLMIDEIPILLIAASLAQGETVINGVKELRVKETDRIDSMMANLRLIGVTIDARAYGDNWRIVVQGKQDLARTLRLKEIHFKSFSDHRTAMSMIVLATILYKQASLDDTACINKSFPGFLQEVQRLQLMQSR